jgi:aspartate aminotransferase/aminotransferase
MKPLAQRVREIPRSGIRAVMELADRVGEVIRLEVGEPHFQPPAHVVAAATEAMRAGFNKYTPNAGLSDVREAIAEKLRRDNGIPATPETVVVTPGGVFACACSFLTLLEPGDEVLLPEPNWPNYSFQVALAGGKTVYYPLHEENGFLPDFAEIQSLVTPHTKAILVNSPSNPTGAVFPRQTVEKLLAFARRNDLYVVSDEVYEKVIFEGEHVSPATYDEDRRVISCFSFSKAYALTGWRIGFATAGADICQSFAKLQEATVSCVSAPAQKGAVAALRGPQDFVAGMVEAYRRNRDAACRLFREAGFKVVEPHGAFYLMLDVSRTDLDSYSFVKRLIEAERVAVAPGLTFGPHCDHYVRVSICKDLEYVAEGVRRIVSFLKRAPGAG